jgi:predicted DNA-binding transcriptional regulator AlpA
MTQRRLKMSYSDGFPKTGFVRLKQILAPGGPIPVSKSTWWAGVSSGRYPQPVKLGPRITAWRAEDIIDLIDRLTTRRALTD